MVTSISTGSSSQVGEVLGVKLILDAVLHEILDDWSPARHLVGLFSDAFFPGWLVNLLAISLRKKRILILERLTIIY
jgi:hypothetical protein